jgi:DNA primase
MNDLAQHAVQNVTAPVRSFLYGRGVTDEQIQQFQIGYLDSRLPNIEGLDAFRVWAGGGSKLPNMLVFPLTNALGDVRGFQFKTAARGVRNYIDYFDGDIDEPILFGLSQAIPTVWSTKSVWLVEGNFDLFPIQRYFPATFPTMTARVTDTLVRFLRRMVSTVWVGYDADKTGGKAAWAFKKAYDKEFDIRLVSYPRYPMLGSDRLTKDPGDLWEARGEQWVQSFVLSHLGTDTLEFGHA